MAERSPDHPLVAVFQPLLVERAAELEQAAGDGWWDLAESEQGPEREMLRLRAAFWYRQALGLLGLPDGAGRDLKNGP